MENFTITFTVTYSPMLIPKGCRKPRPVSTDFEHTISIPKHNSDSAPVAIRYTEDGKTRELRSANGEFYSLARNGIFPAEISIDKRYISTEGEAIAELEFEYSKYVLIDGDVWTLASEPSFQVMTFGMGDNHGGTSLTIARWRDAGDDSPCFHPINDFPGAIEAARATAIERGDNKSLERIGQGLEVEVLVPEAIKLEPLVVRQSRVIESSRLAIAEAYATVRGAENDNLAKAIATLEEVAADTRHRLFSVGLHSY